MADDDSFEPRLGRMRNQGGKRARSYIGRVLAAANLARVGSGSGTTPSAFTGSRIGRGAGVGRMLSRRGDASAQLGRRVVIKASIVRLAGKGLGGAAAHLRYLQRDGTTRDGEPGTLYGAESDSIDGKAFRERGSDDRHQFRFIVSPEDGAEYDDLKSLTRRLMMRVEEDLGTKLDWVAVDHFNTGHPHTHIVVRGKDHFGADLVIAREYLTSGMRERAAELVDIDLGPRSLHDVRQALRAEVEQERLTSIDRAMLQRMGNNRIVEARGGTAVDQTCRAGRLTKLERLGLAESLGAGRWRLAEGLDDTLRRMGERDDIVRTMQRDFSAAKLDRAVADQAIYEPALGDAAPLIGRVVTRGLADEHDDRHYLIVDATDGRAYYVPIGKGSMVEPLAAGSIVRIDANRTVVREVDRTVAAVAGANDGRYDIDSHLRHDPQATEDFADTHVRRLEALRRAGASVKRDPSGSWMIAPDHLRRVATHETAMLRDRPVRIETLSATPLGRLVDADAATWLDREALAETPTPIREAGFGQEVAAAQASRRQWLIAQGFAQDEGGLTTYRSGLLAALQRGEMLRVAGELSGELKLPFAEAIPGSRIDGIVRRPIELVSGRFALIERSRDFTLVPWRPVLERQIGKPVSGILRGDGVSWSIGRGRQGPSIS